MKSLDRRRDIKVGRTLEERCLDTSDGKRVVVKENGPKRDIVMEMEMETENIDHSIGDSSTGQNRQRRDNTSSVSAPTLSK